MRFDMVQRSDVDVLIEHMVRQLQDDRDREKPLSPRGRNRPFDSVAAKDRRLASWVIPPGQAEWARAWAAWQGDQIVGHGELQSGAIPNEAHRAMLGLGVEAHARRRGVAESLMKEIIGWCRNQPAVGWIDLGVFEHNDAALCLYQKLGFSEVARVRDRFRVEGFAVTDIMMTLDVTYAGAH